MFEIFLLVSIAVAAVLFTAYYHYCARKIFALNAELKKILQAEDFDATLRQSELLAPVRKNFYASLTRTNNQTYSTLDAEEFFSAQNLTQGLNMSFWQAYGGIFTGLGILGTFGGLTYGLSNVDMTSGNIEALKSGIAKLLSGVESAFVTSLVGILCAVVYSGIHHILLSKFRENIQLLNNRLDEIYPRRSAEDWLAQSCTIAVNQTNSTVEIGERLANKFDEVSAKICAAIENLSSGGSAAIGEIFSDRVGDKMDRFSDTLDKFSVAIEILRRDTENSSAQRQLADKNFFDTLNALMKTLQTQQSTSAQNFDALIKNFFDALQREKENSSAQRQSADKNFFDMLNALNKNFGTVADKFKNQQEASAKNFDAHIAKLLANFEDFAVQQRKILSNSANSNAAQISDAVNTFRAIVDVHNSVVQKTFDRVENLLNEIDDYLQLVEEASTSLKQAAEPVRRSAEQLNRSLNEFATQMNSLANANLSTRQNISDLSGQLATFVQNFNGLADELERTTQIIKNALENYNTATEAALKSKLIEFDKNITKAFNFLQEITTDLGDTLDDFNLERR